MGRVHKVHTYQTLRGAPPPAAVGAPPNAPPATGLRCLSCHTFNPQAANYCFNCGKPFRTNPSS